MELPGVEPDASRRRRLSQSFYAFLADRDLEYPQPVEGHADPRTIGEEIQIGGIAVPGSDTELVGWSWRALDRGSQQPRGRRRSSSWLRVSYDGGRNASLGEGHCRCQTDQTA